MDWSKIKRNRAASAEAPGVYADLDELIDRSSGSDQHHQQPDLRVVKLECLSGVRHLEATRMNSEIAEHQVEIGITVDVGRRCRARSRG